MGYKGIKEIIGLAMIGEGIVGLFFPRKYTLFWKIGPQFLRDLMEEGAENPELMRLIFLAEAGLGFWLATSQLERFPENSKRLK